MPNIGTYMCFPEDDTILEFCTDSSRYITIEKAVTVVYPTGLTDISFTYEIDGNRPKWTFEGAFSATSGSGE